MLLRVYLYIARAGFEGGRYPSLREVEEGRPRLETSAGETVRAMRDERDERVSGHERSR